MNKRARGNWLRFRADREPPGSKTQKMAPKVPPKIFKCAQKAAPKIFKCTQKGTQKTLKNLSKRIWGGSLSAGLPGSLQNDRMSTRNHPRAPLRACQHPLKILSIPKRAQKKFLVPPKGHQKGFQEPPKSPQALAAPNLPGSGTNSPRHVFSTFLKSVNWKYV